jgi:hypothetical protein
MSLYLDWSLVIPRRRRQLLHVHIPTAQSEVESIMLRLGHYFDEVGLPFTGRRSLLIKLEIFKNQMKR